MLPPAVAELAGIAVCDAGLAGGSAEALQELVASASSASAAQRAPERPLRRRRGAAGAVSRTGWGGLPASVALLRCAKRALGATKGTALRWLLRSMLGVCRVRYCTKQATTPPRAWRGGALCLLREKGRVAQAPQAGFSTSPNTNPHVVGTRDPRVRGVGRASCQVSTGRTADAGCCRASFRCVTG